MEKKVSEAEMNEKEKEKPADMVGSVPHALLDGYDGGNAPPDEYIEELLKDAPDYIKQRMEEVAKGQQEEPAAEK